jgi:hypothetical protein
VRDAAACAAGPTRGEIFLDDLRLFASPAASAGSIRDQLHRDVRQPRTHRRRRPATFGWFTCAIERLADQAIGQRRVGLVEGLKPAPVEARIVGAVHAPGPGADRSTSV